MIGLEPKAVAVGIGEQKRREREARAAERRGEEPRYYPPVEVLIAEPLVGRATEAGSSKIFKVLPDSNITCSSHWDGYGPSESRLHSHGHWAWPNVGCNPMGRPPGSPWNGLGGENQWIQWDLGDIAHVARVQTQGGSGQAGCMSKVHEFSMSWLNDGDIWEEHPQKVWVDSATRSAFSIVENILDPAINARFVRLTPTVTNEYGAAMRIELLGTRRPGHTPKFVHELVLTVHLGELEIDGLASIVCTNMGGEEVASARASLEQPVSDLWAAIRVELGLEASVPFSTLLPDGQALHDGNAPLSSAFVQPAAEIEEEGDMF